MATMLCNLGHRYLEQNDCVTARSFYERALDVHKKIGSPAENQASVLVALGLAWQREGDDRQFDTPAAMSRSINARTYFQRALTIYQEKLGAEHLETAACLMELARTYRLENISTGFWAPSSLDETELPLRYLERALEIRETQLGHDHPDTINCLFAVAFGSSNAGHKSRSRHYFESLLTLFEAKAADELNPLTGNRFLYLAVNVEPYLSQDENEAGHQRLIALFPRVFSESGGAELTEV
jgi:tetratricopeptide (TPR) repeat protein